MITMMIIFVLAMISPESFQDQKYIGLKGVDLGNWKLEKNSGGVQSYVRFITNSEGTDLRERKGEMTVNCSVQDAVRLLTDAGSTKKWMSGISENYCITHINPSEWYIYTLYSIPWPFNKRDLVSLFTLDSDPLHGIANINIVSRDKYVPLKPGITRLVSYKATWVLSRHGESINISFIISSSAPPVFPRVIQDPVIARIFHNNLVRLKEILST